MVGPGAGRIIRVLQPDGADRALPTDPASPVRVRALDRSGEVLSDTGVVVGGASDGGQAGAGDFAVPVATAAHAVELRSGGVLLHRLERSEAPRLRIITPRLGTRARSGRALVVRWSTADAKQELSHQVSVDFSADGGRSWRTVFQGPNRGRAGVPGALLQSTTNARVRVSVNDGFNESSVISDRFRADGRPPQVEIERPVAGELLLAPAAAHLRAHARDDAGRPIRGKALAWYAGRRRLGRGERLRVRSLPRGRVTIRLVARDRLGRVSTASVRIRVRAAAPTVETLAGNRVVPAGTRSVTLRVGASAPAVLTVAGKRFRLGQKPRAIVLRLPMRPKSGLLSLPFRLTNRDGSTRGAIELVRTA
jgi:hypothetical protein